jgi:CheY-like chemotaxis protein
MLRRSRRWEVVGEASDGVRAIQEVHALDPDLILLDVELPTLSGIEAARRILPRNPHSKILFVSAHRSWDIVGAALGTGARGYIHKPDSGHELVPAMETILDGGRFISGSLIGRAFEKKTRGRHAHRPRCHEAGFYSDDTFLLDDYASFAEAALNAGKILVVAASESHRHDLHWRLRARGLDVDSAVRQQKYLTFDVADALSAYMVEGWPDESRFWAASTAFMMAAGMASRQDHPRVAAVGEGSAYLLRQGRADAAVRLERLGDEFARTFNVDSFCGYQTELLPHDDVLQRIGQEHSAVHSR